jgi:hypothetical protein
MAEEEEKSEGVDSDWEWQYIIKDEQEQRTFHTDKREMMSFFLDHFDKTLSSGHSNLSRIISDLINQDKVTEEEAEIRARKMHKAAATVHAQIAFEHFSRNFIEALNVFFKMTQFNAIQHAREELSEKPILIKGKMWEEGWGLVFRHPQQKELRKEALNLFIGHAKKLQGVGGAGRRQKVTAEVKAKAPELLQEVKEFCEEIKSYHDAKKAVFDWEHKRSGYLNDEWIASWLEDAKERFHPPAFVSDWFFPSFASLDSSESNPGRIALVLLASIFDIAPSTLEKYCIRPARRKANRRRPG